MHFRTKAQYLLASTAAFAVVTLGGASAACAADGDAPKADATAKPDSSGIGEIIVTANKREESLSKVGLTINALGGAQLKQQNIKSVQDLASAVPGLTYTQTDSNTPVYTLRGIGFYDVTLGGYPSVSVYLDEAPLSFPTLTKLTLFDLERVEVLKGPQGTLFGNNATGGAINFIAAKPTRDFDAGVSLDYARFNTFTGDAHISGPITDNLLGRIAIEAQSGDGWQRSITRPGDKNGAPDTFAARFLLDWRPTDRLRIQTNLNGWRDRTEPPQAQFVKFIPNFPIPAGSAFVPFVPNAVNNARLADWTPLLQPKADNRLLQATLRADYDVTDAITLTSLTTYVDYKQRQVPVGDGVAQERIDVYKNDGYIHSFSTELRLADNKDPVFRWTLGANFSHDVTNEDDGTAQADSTSAFTDQFAGLPFPGNEFTNHQIMKNYAVFGAAEYTLGQFTLKGSVRYTQADRTSYNCNLGYTAGNDNYILDYFNILTQFVFQTATTPYPAGTCTIFAPDFTLHQFKGVLNQSNVSWRAGVDWKPSNNVLGYLNVAKGFKAGSFPALSGSLDLAYSPVTQESVLDVEGGFKLQLLDRKLSLNISAFYNDYLNKQVKSKLVDPLFGPLDALVNIPKSEIKGFEVEANARPVRGLSLGGSLTYLDSKILSHTTLYSLSANPGDWAGNPIPRTSKWNVGANFNYSFPVGATTSAFLGAQLSYRSSSTSSIGNEPDFRLPGYTTIDAQAGLDLMSGKARVMVWGKNITNKFYLVNIYQYTDGIARFMGKPATYGVTVSYKF